MKLPRLKMRKNTRATLGRLMIAVASLYALAMAYDEARDNLWNFFFGTLSLLALILVFAAALVAVLYTLRWLKRKLFPGDDDNSNSF